MEGEYEALNDHGRDMVYFGYLRGLSDVFGTWSHREPTLQDDIWTTDRDKTLIRRGFESGRKYMQ